jgi:HEAT repeat protein
VLGACGRADDAPLLLGLLHADSPPVRAAAAEGLSGLPVGAQQDDIEDALCYALADEVADVRAAAARGLARFSSTRAAAALQGASADADAAVRAAAVRGLGALGSEAARATLRALCRSADGAVAVHAIEALARPPAPGVPDEGTDEVLLGALGSEDGEIVKAAVRALAERYRTHAPTGAAFAGVERALVHPRWDVRRAAAAALARLGGERSLAALRARAAVEEDTLVRAEIAAALSPPEQPRVPDAPSAAGPRGPKPRG